MQRSTRWFVTLALCLAGATARASPSRLFAVPGDGTDKIVELNRGNGAAVNEFPTPEPVDDGAVGLGFDGDSLWFVCSFGTDQLWELDPDTGAVRHAYSISKDAGGKQVFFDFDGVACAGGKVYVLEYVKDDILEFDPATGTVTRVLDLTRTSPGLDFQGGLAGAGNRLLATVVAQGSAPVQRLVEIDPATGTVARSFNAANPGVLGAAVVDNEVFLGYGGQPRIEVYSRAGAPLRMVTPPFPLAALGGDSVGSDADGDGVPDHQDHCPNSDLRARVTTSFKKDTTIPNSALGVDANGCTVQDHVNAFAASAANRKAYVQRVKAFARLLRDQGTITARQAKELNSGAARFKLAKAKT